MSTKRIQFDGMDWLWPEHDTKLQQVNSWVSDLERLGKILPKKDGLWGETVIQAGGACGVWPAYLAERFKTVLTFEPSHVNFSCLVANCHYWENIIPFRAALGACNRTFALKQPQSEVTNAGTRYVDPAAEGYLPMLMLDDVALAYHISAIVLDVEGYELEALKGASVIIDAFRPVIMLEDKILPQMDEMKVKKGEAIEWLAYYDYVVADQIHNDYILVPKEAQ